MSNIHTLTEFYVAFPTDLFRGGTPTQHNIDYIRTMPPRKADQRFDVKLNRETGMIDHTSGGLSLFNATNNSFSSNWWMIPASTPLPDGFTLTKDFTNGKFKGHYTIRAIADMSVSDWKTKLREWADKHAVYVKK
jgi:hypothetical protein